MRITLLTLTLFTLAACSGGNDKGASSKDKTATSAHDHGAAKEKAGSSAAAKPAAKPQEAAPAAPAAPAVAIPEGATKVVVNGNDAMQFDVKEIRVKAGAKVALTLNHTGKLPKASMGHNLVILAAGTDLITFVTAATGAAAEDYVPKSQAESVVAATKLIGGGESDTVIFDAPAAGTYDFICSFPGHYAIMKGKFIVE